MKTILTYTEEQPYNGYRNIYQAMCVKQDLTNSDSSESYKDEELALEVV